MIYTVFPGGEELPQDFSTKHAAEEYQAWLLERGIESTIESTEGEIV